MPDQPNTTVQAETKPLFIGLESYSEAQSNMFFGRDEEIKSLYSLIRSNTFTIVFGKSGTGKTSLLNAGVFPKLRADYCLPFRIRLEFNENSPGLITQIKTVLRTEIDKYGFSVDSYPGEETLWEYFHKEKLWHVVTPVLVFDQFEEIFTLAKKSVRYRHQELDTLIQELSDLIENNIPEKLKEKIINRREELGFNYNKQKAKVIFAFREEYLPDIETITTKIPSVKQSRFRLMPMSGLQAFEVITKTWKDAIHLNEANRIVSFLSNEPDPDKFGHILVEPSLLSQVCAFIDRERISENRDKISADFLDRHSPDFILRSVYEEAVNESYVAGEEGEGKNKKPVNLLRIFIENNLITNDGFRTKYELKQEDDILRPGIDRLKSKYFLRGQPDEAELTHDVLVPIIKTDRETRRRKEVIAKYRRRIIVIGLIIAAIIWAATTGVSLVQRNQIEAEIKTKNDSLNIIKDSIEAAQKRWDNFDKDHQAGYREIIVYRDRIIKDSLKIDSLNQIKDRIETELAAKNQELSKLQMSSRIDLNNERDANNELSQKIRDFILKSDEWKKDKADLERLLNGTNLKLKLANASIEEKDRIIDSLLDVIHHPPVPGPNKIKRPFVDVYLLPENEHNKKIIRRSAVYEIGCYDMRLSSAEGVQKTKTDKDGVYRFDSVAPGKYFLKFCDYYGPYYFITINKDQSNLIGN